MGTNEIPSVPVFRLSTASQESRELSHSVLGYIVSSFPSTPKRQHLMRTEMSEKGKRIITKPMTSDLSAPYNPVLKTRDHTQATSYGPI